MFGLLFLVWIGVTVSVSLRDIVRTTLLLPVFLATSDGEVNKQGGGTFRYAHWSRPHAIYCNNRRIYTF